MGSSTFVLLALVCGLAVAQDDMFQTGTLTPTPTATPVPPNPPNPVVNQTFVLQDKVNSSYVCLRMMVAISMNLTYTNEDKQNTSRLIALTGNSAVDDRSTCNSTANYAKLVVALNEEDVADMGELYMAFEFNGSKDSWSLGEMDLTFDTTLLDGYDGDHLALTFHTEDKLHDTANNDIEYTRSYKCHSDQTLYFNKSNNIAPIVLVSELRVQAFKFENKTSGAFDNARSCLLDTAGKANKIVPIAVGAALAGLVVVVLIAYLIGRLRSRRQSSYEALS